VQAGVCKADGLLGAAVVIAIDLVLKFKLPALTPAAVDSRAWI
jgi:hypothetical protein